MGHQSASDLCQSGSYGLRVGGTATTAERYNIQHNSRTPDWPGLWLSCSVPDECLGSAKRDGNGPRIPGAYVGYDNLSRADDACNPGFKSRTARRPGDHPARLNGSDANSTGCRSHRCRDLVDCGCGRARAKVSSQVHRHSASVFVTSEVNGSRYQSIESDGPEYSMIVFQVRPFYPSRCVRRQCDPGPGSARIC